jgi:hypothetical protein
MTDDEIARRAEACRLELERMDYFEGTIRKDDCIGRHLRYALEAAEEENERLANELVGVRKAYDLLHAGMGSQCELMDEMKQRGRTLEAENADLRAKLEAAERRA